VQSQAYLIVPFSARAATQRQFLTDALDVWIPATGAELVGVNEGLLGILGYVIFCVSSSVSDCASGDYSLITSLMGVSAQWKAVVSK
jgi:peroxin-11B